MRAHELAKELGMETKKLLLFAPMVKVAIKSNLSAVSEEDAEKVRQAIARMKGKKGKAQADKKETKPKAKKKAAPKKAAAKKAPAKKPAKEAEPEAKPAAETAEPATATAVESPPAAKAKPEKPEPEAPKVEAPPAAPPKAPPKPTITIQGAAVAGAVEATPIRRKPRIRTVKFKKRGRSYAPPPRPKVRQEKIELASPITLKSLSSELGVKASEIIAKLMSKGLMPTINSVIEDQMAEEICLEYETELIVTKPKNIEERIVEEVEPDKPEDLKHRAPVVTMLGHVDHGKTSLLDKIRKTNVVDSEAGGITQHIGAYVAKVNDREVVFLDTPGHEAFTQMRARGAHATDIVVLVVAADDGVMPQTEEAINHAKAAGVKIVVAVNKVDKPNANAHRTMQQLATIGVNPQQWGGDTEFVEVSAITGQGLDQLVETLALEAEMLELKGNPDKPATGTVLEAGMSPGRGIETTVLVQDGTLRRGDFVIAGKAAGNVRSLHNHRGKAVPEAAPSTPVVVSGLSEIPEAGDSFQAVRDSARARKIADERRDRRWRAEVMERGKQAVTLDNLFSTIEEGKAKELKLVVKADAQGSIEVLRSSLQDQSTDEAKVTILHTGIGGITESDVLLAAASEGIIIGFHVVPDEKARALAEDRGVEIRLYKIIYELLQEVHQGLEGMLEPEQREVVLGHAEVRQLFKVSRLGTIAGCYVPDGRITRNAQVRVTRDGTVIYEGRLQSLRRVKEDVREVQTGFECGIHVAGFDDVKVGDIIEAFEVQQVKRTLA